MLYFHQKKLLSIHKGVLLKWSEKTLSNTFFIPEFFHFIFYYSFPYLYSVIIMIQWLLFYDISEWFLQKFPIFPFYHQHIPVPAASFLPWVVHLLKQQLHKHPALFFHVLL